MRLKIITIGTRAEPWVNQGFNTYAQRMPRHLALELVELTAPSRKKMAVDACRLQEAQMLHQAADQQAYLIALHEHGQSYRSQELAQRLERWLNQGRDLAFIIGGPDGLAPAFLQRVDSQWSLGPLTLPHALVRIVVAEQLYRAWSLLNGHPYHRE